MSKTVWKSLLVLVLILSTAVAAYQYYRKKEAPQPCLVQSYSPKPPAGDPNVLPGGRPEDTALAQSDPDEYAWKLFLAINRQALTGKRGAPDPNKPMIGDYEDNKPVIWETWALSSGGRNGNHPLPEKNTSEVFKDRGQTPEPWDQLSREDKSFETYPSKQMQGVGQFVNANLTAAEVKSNGASTIAAELKNNAVSTKDIQAAGERKLVQRMMIEPSAREEEQGIGEEVRMNRPLFENVVAHNLYNIEGLEEVYRRIRDSQGSANPEKFEMPAASQEIKARWARIREEDKPRYHWRQIKGSNGQPEIWGLTALHVITKDLKDWFWSDFEHIDYLALPVQSVDPGFGADLVDTAEVESRDSTTRGCCPAHAARDCQGKIIQGLRAETAGTKWANYRLRGTQTTFCAEGDACKDQPTVLANTQLERGFQQTSSCITCHSRASIGERANPDQDFIPNRLKVFLKVQSLEPSGFLLIGAIGEKQESWFLDNETKKLKYAQTDYVWTLSERAMSTKVFTAPTVQWPACSKPCPSPSPSDPGP